MKKVIGLLLLLFVFSKTHAQEVFETEIFSKHLNKFQTLKIFIPENYPNTLLAFPIAVVLNSDALSQVYVNGVYQLTKLNNYSVIKVKCGFRNLYDEIELLDNLVQQTNSDIEFILDINQAYDLPKAIRFLNQ